MNIGAGAGPTAASMEPAPRAHAGTGAECGRPRQSIAFFMQADKEALIESSGEAMLRATTSSCIRSNFAAKFGDK